MPDQTRSRGAKRGTHCEFATPLRAAPYRIAVTGHTSKSKVPAPQGYGPWELSLDRANAVRRILQEEGVPEIQFYMASGKADTEPLFPDDPYMLRTGASPSR